MLQDANRKVIFRTALPKFQADSKFSETLAITIDII